VDPNDEERYREFVAARSSALLRTAYLLMGDRGQAEDLLQTALTKTYLAWGRIRDHGAIEAYVRRTLATTATSWWRRRWHRETPTELLPEAVTIADAAVAQAERDELWQHLQRLPSKQRAVLVLRYYEDLTEAQVADALGVTTGTVKSHASRALATLRGRMADAERSPVGFERVGEEQS
jgi:RNA polymerase sigma-70 factor (sigma-E family)